MEERVTYHLSSCLAPIFVEYATPNSPITLVGLVLDFRVMVRFWGIFSPDLALKCVVLIGDKIGLSISCPR